VATIAVGDIHGNLAALTDLLGQLRADAAAGDVVVFLGDYIDRGPDSRQCIDAILSFKQDIPADVVCLRGNHEDWLLRTRADYTKHSWLLGMDPYVTVRSYSAEAERMLRHAMQDVGLRLYVGTCSLPYDVFFDTMPQSHRTFFDQLVLSFQSEACICSHAGVDPRVADLADQTEKSLVWGNGPFPDNYRGQRTVVYGHRNNAELDPAGWPRPRITGNTIGIDTISHGVLTAIRLPDRRVYQSARHLVAGLGV
jgi:serine/threonine protein phosphatase 1